MASWRRWKARNGADALLPAGLPGRGFRRLRTRACVAYGATQADADRAADAVACNRVTASEGAFKGRVFSARGGRGVRRWRLAAGAIAGPIVISDTQDNPGAGGDSDTMGMAHALVQQRRRHAPRSASSSMRPRPRPPTRPASARRISLSLGAKSGIPGDAAARPAEFLVEQALGRALRRARAVLRGLAG
jgi:microcystin degradation protein MlrC